MNIGRITKLFKYLMASILLIVGLIGFLRGEFVESESYPPDLSRPSGIVVDDEGRIYCGIIHGSKINIYDKNGVFSKSINVNADGGVFRIKLNNDKLEVATARNDMLYVFDYNGALISKEKNEESYDSYEKTNEKNCIDKNNNEYRIKNIFSIRSVLKVGFYESFSSLVVCICWNDTIIARLK